ncbi:recombinase family protein [Micromonospora aurantiaca (nom. illeg.)]|uniref:recombinase family protein n=1 Tax=Micromonospora aurantiaca (nom. illeg.) TaxID=47850 RepID=UPI00340E68A7
MTTTLPEWLRPAATSALPRQTIRVAFLGRTSTDEQQDPTLSLPRQLTNSERALLPGMEIVAWFYDVESSRKELTQRGSSTAWSKFDIGIQRHGGLNDLLAEATAPNRRFDVVICESIDRIARYTHQGTKIEHDLELAGVPLLAADEPIILDGQTNGRKRKRASQVLLRRTKQGVAEWYIIEMLEKSWDGFETHTTQGWNVGKPPYGYLAEKHKHPVPAKRAQGKHKTKLQLDPVRGPVVALIFAWRVDEQLGYRAIADRLNTDLDRYPPPQPVDPERAVGRWTGSAVREILCNLKYTGYMVWNRRSTKDKLHPGKNNRREEWVVSEAPTHKAAISLDVFFAAQAIANARQGSRSDALGATANPHRQTAQVYRLRSHVHCTMCQRRMHGKTKRTNIYYYCQPRQRAIPEGHPPSIWLPERDLLDGIVRFFNAHVFGTDRIALASRSIDVAGIREADEHQQKIEAVRRAVADADARLGRLTTILEERDDPDGSVFDRVNRRMAELEQQKALRQAELTHLVKNAPAAAPGPVELLDALPTMEIRLEDLPADRLHHLLNAFMVQIHYDRRGHRATYRAQISADAIPDLTAATGTPPAPAYRIPRQRHAHEPVGPANGGADPGWRSSLTCPAGGTSQNCKHATRPVDH